MAGGKAIPAFCQALWDKARALGRGRFTTKLMKQEPQVPLWHGPFMILQLILCSFSPKGPPKLQKPQVSPNLTCPFEAVCHFPLAPYWGELCVQSGHLIWNKEESPTCLELLSSILSGLCCQLAAASWLSNSLNILG